MRWFGIVALLLVAASASAGDFVACFKTTGARDHRLYVRQVPTPWADVGPDKVLTPIPSSGMICARFHREVVGGAQYEVAVSGIAADGSESAWSTSLGVMARTSTRTATATSTRTPVAGATATRTLAKAPGLILLQQVGP